jgi:hypothetical protein
MGRLDAEFRSSLAAAAHKHLRTGRRPLAHQETMGCGALSLLRLICSLWHKLNYARTVHDIYPNIKEWDRWDLLFPAYIAVPMLYTCALHETLELRDFLDSIYSFPHPGIMHHINFPT